MADAPLRIDIRDRRIPGGRLNLSAATTNRKLAAQREAAVRALLDNGDLETIRLLRERKLHISEVQVAVRKGTVEQLKPKKSDSATLGVQIEKVLKAVKATREVKTHRLYSYLGKGLLEHFGPDKLLRQVDKDAAEAFLHKPRQDGRPWGALHQRQYATFAARLWRAAGIPEVENPWKQAERPRRRTKRQAFLQPAEWDNLAGHHADTPALAMLALGCLAGLREGEVVNLRTDLDVDLEKRVVRVQPREGEFAWRPKTDNSVREVPIADELYRILARHVELGFAGARYFLRLPKLDRPIAEQTIIHWTERAFTKAGIRYGLKHDGLTNHSLRHTFATWLLLERVPVHVVARLMGDTVKVVMDTYAHLLVQDLEGAVAVLDKVLVTERRSKQ